MTVYESKSKRERTFRLSDELYAELKKSVKYKRRASILFQGAQGASKPLHRSTIHRHIKKALRGQNFDASAHSMRKLYAHMVFNNTHDITAVQAALNHKNIITTCAYLDIDVQKLIIMSQEGNK
jgi:integrase